MGSKTVEGEAGLFYSGGDLGSLQQGLVRKETGWWFDKSRLVGKDEGQVDQRVYISYPDLPPERQLAGAMNWAKFRQTQESELVPLVLAGPIGAVEVKYTGGYGDEVPYVESPVPVEVVWLVTNEGLEMVDVDGLAGD